MPFSGTTYSEISSGADTVEDLIAAHQSRLRGVRLEASNIVSSLTALSNEWGSIVGAASSLLTADANNLSKQVLNSHVQQLLADFESVMTEASALDADINA
jgi:phage terminase Nu1 subunit (DNA packaging protein)